MEKELSQETKEFVDALLFDLKTKLVKLKGMQKGTPSDAEMMLLSNMFFSSAYIHGFAKERGYDSKYLPKELKGE